MLNHLISKGLFTINVASQLLLKKKGIKFILLIACSVLMSENSSSQKKWSRDNVKILCKFDNSIYIECYFIDYEFGPRGEHAYFEWVEFEFSLDGKHYEKLMRCEANDQLRVKTSFVYLKNKLKGAKILFTESLYPYDHTTWEDNTNIRAVFNNYLCYGSLYIAWLLYSDTKIHSILVKGKWHVNGLNCSEYIQGDVYPVKKQSSLTSDIKTDFNKQYLNTPVNQLENKAVKLYKEPDAVVVQGADFGITIKIFTTAGKQINETIVNSDIVKIKLPANQFYLIHIGQARYKVAI